MTRWFVYCNTSYYPWAEIVEAASAAEAILKSDADGSTERGVAVFPFDALALWHGTDESIEHALE